MTKRMTDWGYRVVKHTDSVFSVFDEPYVYFDIREVYRNGDKGLSWTKESKPPIGDTPDELKADLEMMLRACDLPVLVERGNKLVEL